MFQTIVNAVVLIERPIFFPGQIRSCYRYLSGTCLINCCCIIRNTIVQLVFLFRSRNIIIRIIAINANPVEFQKFAVKCIFDHHGQFRDI